MKKGTKVIAAVMTAAMIISCTCMFSFATVHSDADTSSATGTFTACTYNVGGLPFAGSSSCSKSKQIGKLISNYDIVNVQENFTYNAVIRANLSKKTVSRTNHIFGKFVGMDSFSKFTIKDSGYVKWTDTYGGIANDGGADKYAAKGIRYFTVVLPSGGEIDVYNYHTDAGGEDTATDGSLAARRSNLSQLAALVNERSVSKDRAVIVMGDSNSRYTRTNDNLKELLTDKCGLTDAWVQLVRNGEFPEKGSAALTVSGTDAVDLSTENADIEKVDKVMYRSGADVKLDAISYTDTKATNSKGSSLSDHNPLVVGFAYTYTGTNNSSSYVAQDLTWLDAIKNMFGNK